MVSALDEDYLEDVESLYARAADSPQPSLCCTQTPVWKLPGLTIPQGMIERNYGCGTTVHPSDLSSANTALYVGVGAGLEALQMSWFMRREGAVIALDKVSEMLETASALLDLAEKLNPWFRRNFVTLRKGDALSLPIGDESVDLASQNCLFNIFTRQHLSRALREMHRVLRPRGKLALSDPVATRPLPQNLVDDPKLRAQCLSGALKLDEYLGAIVDAGFGTIEVRAKRPYRVLGASQYGLAEPLLLESVEIVAIKDPVAEDGPCIFTGRTATYVGSEEFYDDGKGHSLTRNLPAGVCDKTACALASLERDDIVLTPSTWHYPGDGCC
ncbi:MAG: arsenosugar biosynthesis arsenite methyltransferase ArsM [Proteobacteria bacterium]|nr:arsenosugar biosynthesis arsenite methyltransferase ArsM [Pseudomonadota bacterium]